MTWRDVIITSQTARGSHVICVQIAHARTTFPLPPSRHRSVVVSDFGIVTPDDGCWQENEVRTNEQNSHHHQQQQYQQNRGDIRRVGVASAHAHRRRHAVSQHTYRSRALPSLRPIRSTVRAGVTLKCFSIVGSPPRKVPRRPTIYR